MSERDFIAVVLAAGQGTRLKSAVAKVLHRAGGRALVEHVVLASRPLVEKVHVVVGHQAEDVRAVVAPLGCSTILQRPQNGTGHAMLIARAAIGNFPRFAIVLPGDAPLIRTETLESLIEAHRAGEAAATILTARLEDPSGYGRAVRKADGAVAAIVEDKAASAAEREIREINSSVYCFTLETLWPALAELRPDNIHHELYLTDAISVLAERNERVLAVEAADAREILGCNTREELAEADRFFRTRKAAELMDSGVTIYLPETALIDPEVSIGRDSVIEPGVQLLGATRIGANCAIQTGSIITDSVLEDGVHIRQHSIITSSCIGTGAIVGPFAHLRDGAELRPGSRVGNFVEVKKSVLGEGVKAMHLSYLGDAAIGKQTNIGAGTITCNYDGVKKNPTCIGEHVFVGSDSALVAPVSIGDGAYIAAGSTITEDVPADALGIARGRQVNKPGWVSKRRGSASQAAENGSAAVSSAASDPKSARKRSKKNRPARSKTQQ